MLTCRFGWETKLIARRKGRPAVVLGFLDPFCSAKRSARMEGKKAGDSSCEELGTL